MSMKCCGRYFYIDRLQVCNCRVFRLFIRNIECRVLRERDTSPSREPAQYTIVLHCTPLYCTVHHCTALSIIALQYTSLYYTAVQ